LRKPEDKTKKNHFLLSDETLAAIVELFAKAQTMIK
jgi:hypothetical protein